MDVLLAFVAAPTADFHPGTVVGKQIRHLPEHPVAYEEAIAVLQALDFNPVLKDAKIVLETFDACGLRINVRT